MQHEIDHLNGVLFIDHISKLKRDRVIKKFTRRRSATPSRRAATAVGRSTARLRLIFMGTPDFAVPTLIEIAGARP